MKSMVKPLIIIAIIILLLSSTVTDVNAVSADITPYYSYTTMTTQHISIGWRRATATASLTGIPGTTTHIQVDMSVQRQEGDNWVNVKTWHYTVDDYIIAVEDSCWLFITGRNFRTRAVYTVYAGSASETITGYSQVTYY